MKLNRRSFLKKTVAAGSMLAGAGSFLSACSSITRSDMPIRDSARNSIGSLDEVRTSILYILCLTGAQWPQFPAMVGEG